MIARAEMVGSFPSCFAASRAACRRGWWGVLALAPAVPWPIVQRVFRTAVLPSLDFFAAMTGSHSSCGEVSVSLQGIDVVRS